MTKKQKKELAEFYARKCFRVWAEKEELELKITQCLMFGRTLRFNKKNGKLEVL